MSHRQCLFTRRGMTNLDDIIEKCWSALSDLILVITKFLSLIFSFFPTTLIIDKTLLVRPYLFKHHEFGRFRTDLLFLAFTCVTTRVK